MLTQSISRNSLLLSFFAIISTAVIAATFLNTRDAIKDNIRKAEEKALLEIIPRSRHDNAMLDDAYPISDSQYLNLREEKKLYIARRDNRAIALIVPATARDGYTGDIDIIVGINIDDGSVAGVRVLSHRETPGLGDGIDIKKSQWIEGFLGKSLLNPTIDKWTVKRDKGVFDQFTGATITPRAVTKAVAKALQYFAENRQQLINLKTVSTQFDEVSTNE